LPLITYSLDLPNQFHLSFCLRIKLRIKKDAFIEIEAEIWLQLRDSGLAPGVSFFLSDLKYTKTAGFINFNIAGKSKRRYLGVTPSGG
jgi:hypothetical protein